MPGSNLILIKKLIADKLILPTLTRTSLFRVFSKNKSAMYFVIQGQTFYGLGKSEVVQTIAVQV